jgi:hypothetical protein
MPSLDPAAPDPEPASDLSSQLSNALAQLQRSSRGIQALLSLKRLLDNGGAGLDTANFTALRDIFDACARGDGRLPYMIRDALHHYFRGVAK